jgi:hypothetical protein
VSRFCAQLLRFSKRSYQREPSGRSSAYARERQIGSTLTLTKQALRVVVRNGYSRDPADMFLDDLKRLLVRLEKQSSPSHDESSVGFSH